MITISVGLLFHIFVSVLIIRSSVEADVSLTRNDFFLSPARDNYRMNGTLFDFFTDVANRVGGGNFTRETMISYQAVRYRQSLADNGQFFYGSHNS